jgi:uncharacterized damage-inducible protein DinB
MIDKAAIHTLYEYHYWANRRILDTAEQIHPEQFLAPTPVSRDSLADTLIHMMWAEWMWRQRMQQGVSPAERWGTEDFPTLASLRERWNVEEQQMWGFLAALRNEDIAHPVAYRNTRGTAFTNPLWQVLLHLLNHGTQHRSEAAAMLTTWGYSPGDIDLIVFLRR